MSSPVGHSLVALNFYFSWTPYKGWKQLWEQKWEITTAIILTNLPDVDMFLGLWIYGDRHTFHRELTHSPFFALLLALTLSFFSQVIKARGGIPLLIKTLQYFTLVFSHGVLDFFSGDELGLRSGQGVAMLYPWDTKKYSSPVALLPAVDLTLGIRAISNWQTVAYETILFGGLLFVVIWSRRRKFQS